MSVDAMLEMLKMMDKIFKEVWYQDIIEELYCDLGGEG